MSGFIYVMAREQGDVKIGISINPDKRLTHVRMGVGDNLEVVGAWAHSWPHRVEQEAHRLLRIYRTGGEWFAVSKYLAFDAVTHAMRKIDADPRKPPLPVSPEPEKIRVDLDATYDIPPPETLTDHWRLGYVCTTDGVPPAAQYRWILASGVPKDRIYIERVTGGCPDLDDMMRNCRKGDVVLAWSPDVFGHPEKRDAILAEIAAKGAVLICPDLRGFDASSLTT